MEAMIIVQDRENVLKHYFNLRAMRVWLFHLAAVYGVRKLGFSWQGLGTAVGFFYLRVFFITGAYHRYFSQDTAGTNGEAPCVALGARRREGSESRADA
jgi:hypothetical protein